MKTSIVALLLSISASFAQAPSAEQLAPLSQDQFPQVDAIVQKAMKTGLISGAVLIIGHEGEVVHRQAYGSRALVPRRETMTLDTIFDAASLTKVVATTPCVMKRFEQGKVRLDDPVTKYLPEFKGGQSDITVRSPMTHFSGMPPDLILKPRWSGSEIGIQKALVTEPIATPGARLIYSNINSILMGEIVRRLSGETLPQFAHEQIFAPLAMIDSQFQPPVSLRARIAPTQIDPDAGGRPLKGLVHDPPSRYMSGVARHSGLFTTADELAKYAEMLSGLGQRNGVRVLQPATVKKLIEPGSLADQPILRGLGRDIDFSFSTNRELYPIGSLGYTGYTGPEMWIDPATNSFVPLLTNVVHPNGIKSLSSLRSSVPTAVAAAFGLNLPGTVSPTRYHEIIMGAGVHRVVNRDVKTLAGIDVLEEDGFAELKGKRIGLLTNQTGFDRAGRRDVDAMLAAGVQVVSLFSPEHGFSVSQDTENIPDTKDSSTGLPVVSLYEPGKRRLTAEQMRNLDAVVYDVQDVGTRFWTYSCTLLYAVEESGKAKKPFFVLDRPNPITGTHVEGPMLENDLHSFTGCYEMPLRHGMTFGELATMANAEQHWGADLRVIKLKNWERGDWFDATTLTWVNPSPNMRSLNAALLYPGVGMIEYARNYSVGRGTDAPFEQIGADWIDGPALTQLLNSRFIPGVRVYPTRFRPSSSNLKDVDVSGVRFVITDRDAFDSTRLGIELAAALQKLFPGKIDFEKCRLLIGNHAVLNELKNGTDASAIWSKAQEQASQFAERRKPYLLY